MLLSESAKTTRVMDAETAGQTTLTGDAVDCRDFHTVCFYAAIGTVTAGGSGTVKAQGSDASASGFEDLDGASLAYTDADADGVLVLEVSQPRQRYVRVVIERADENSVIDSVIALQAMAQAEPVEHDATVAGSKLVLAPATA